MVVKQSIDKQYRTKVLDHLGLVAGMCSELGISNIIDEHIPVNSADKILSTGNAVVGLILNGLGFVNKRLYLVSRFFENKPVDKLLNVSYLDSSHFNDDALGRSLDAIYDFGVSEMFALISSEVIGHLRSEYGLKVGSGQLDNTNFHLHCAEKELTEANEVILKINKGYSKDHRPDLVQVGLQLIVENQSGIPLLMKVLDGNQEESQSYGQFINEYAEQLQNNYDLNLIVVDSKLYNLKNLPILGGKPALSWLTRVPNGLEVVKDLITHIDKKSFKPLQDYEKYQYQEVCNTYGGVKQRWLVLKSEDKFTRDLKKLDKRVNRGKCSKCYEYVF
jgi:transposase